MPSCPVDVALIGLGGYGAAHRRALQTLEREGLARLAAAAETDQVGQADVVGSLRQAGVKVYQDWQDLLAAGGFDFVAVAAPLHLHRTMAVEALQRGYPVFCEKSAAVTVQDVAAMATASAEAGLPCGIDFQMLSAPFTQRIKQLVMAETLGQIRRVVGIGLWKRADAYYQRNGWAGKFRIGDSYVFDGPMCNALAHMLNNCLYLASSLPGKLLRPQEVRGEMYRAIPLAEMEDTATVHVRGMDGVEVLYFATYCHSIQEPHYYRLEGTEGVAEFTENRLVLRPNNGSQDIEEFRGQGDTEAMYRNFLAVLAGKEELISPVEESLHLVRVQNGAYMSSGRIHEVKPPYSHRYAENGTVATEIRDLGSHCYNCAKSGHLPSDEGIPWAHSTSWKNVVDLNRYAPSSPDALSDG